MSVGGLLAVHAHPDDETLSTGALLATWAAAGPVTVVTCTRGERGEVIPAELRHLEGDGSALAEHRMVELADALAALGVSDHVFLDQLPADGRDGIDGGLRYTDSGMVWAGPGQAVQAEAVPDGAFVTADLDAAARRLADLVRSRRPDVVVGYEPGGGYGHPDHVQAHRVMQRAVELAAGPDGAEPPFDVPVVLWAALDEGVLRRAHRLLATGSVPSGRTHADAEGPLPSAVVPSASVDLRVDLAAVQERVFGALRAHATQVEVLETASPPGAAASVGDEVLGAFTLSNRVLQPLLRWEAYRYAPGRPVGEVRWPAGVVTRVA